MRTKLVKKVLALFYLFIYSFFFIGMKVYAVSCHYCCDRISPEIKCACCQEPLNVKQQETIDKFANEQEQCLCFKGINPENLKAQSIQDSAKQLLLDEISEKHSRVFYVDFISTNLKNILLLSNTVPENKNLQKLRTVILLN